MRETIIKHLINLDKPIDEIKKSLKGLGWDSDDEITMAKGSVKSILNRYIESNIDSKTLNEWANTIEGREDIDYDESCFNEIKQLVYEIANPDLEGPFDIEKAKGWLSKLD